MRNRDKSTTPSPTWTEAASIRETTMRSIDDAKDRKAIRRLSRMLYLYALETTRGPFTESPTRDELRAAAADLRYLEGYLSMTGDAHSASSLPPPDDDLARFAGKLAGKVGAIAESIEGRLS
jgi:hypothetical protein